MIKVRQLSKSIYLLDEDGNSTSYVVVGSEKALLVDTMYGMENIKDFVATITPLPVTVVNTHSHPDHIGGNRFFEQVYMHPADMPFVEQFTKEEHRNQLPQLLPVKEGHVFDLGGIDAVVHEIPGHSPGQICLHIAKEKILISGDAINRHLWMQVPDTLTLEDYMQVLKNLEPLIANTDYILHAHATGLEDVALYWRMRKGIQELLDQDPTALEVSANDAPYQWFGGVDKCHQWDKVGSVICYRVNRIWN